MGGNLIKDIAKEKAILAQLAALYENGDEAVAISKEDLSTTGAREILDQLEIDNVLASQNQENLAYYLTKFKAEIDQIALPYAARIYQERSDFRMEIFPAPSQLLVFYAVGIATGNVTAQELYDDFENLDEILFSKLTPWKQVYDGDKPYPSREKVHPDRVIPTIANMQALLGDVNGLVSTLLEIASMVRIIRTASDRSVAAEPAREFLEAFNSYALQSMAQTHYGDPRMYVIKDLVKLGLKKVYGIVVEDFEQATVDNLPNILNLTKKEQKTYRDLNPQTKEMLAGTVRSPDGLMAAYSIQKLFHNGFAEKYGNELDKLAALTAKPLRSPQADWIQHVHRGGPAHLSLASHSLFLFAEPLSIHQGPNPTCLSTALISYLAQVEPGLLLSYMEEVLEHGFIEISSVDGTILSSRELAESAISHQPPLSALALLLVPDFDALYQTMVAHFGLTDKTGPDVSHPHEMLQVYFKGNKNLAYSDIHLQDFYRSGDFKDAEVFLQAFYGVFHPDYNPAISGSLPRWAGITIFDPDTGQRIGFHAVIIQRIEKDRSGTVRVFYFNPNFEDASKLGPRIQPTTWENGEKAGESSLSFEDFARVVNFATFDPKTVVKPVNLATPNFPSKRFRASAMSRLQTIR